MHSYFIGHLNKLVMLYDNVKISRELTIMHMYLLCCRENDEIILLQGTFLPNKTHDEVLDLFKEIKVDGESLNKLVRSVPYTCITKLKLTEIVRVIFHI